MHITYCSTSLTVAPQLPIEPSMISTGSMFSGCTSLTTAPYIGSNIASLDSCFYGCTHLTGSITIDANPGYGFDNCFGGNAGYSEGVQHIVLTGNSYMLNELAETGNNITVS